MPARKGDRALPFGAAWQTLVPRQPFYGLDAIANLHLLEEMAHVVFHGANGQAEPIGNLLVG